MKDRVEIEKLYIFDMDNTILKNPQKEDCERVWLEKFGTKWPYQGVYSKPESLDFNIFNIPTIPHVIEKYNEVKDENNIHNVRRVAVRVQSEQRSQVQAPRFTSTWIVSDLEHSRLLARYVISNTVIIPERNLYPDPIDQANRTYVRSKSFASFLTTSGQMTSSPSLGDSGNDKIFVALSLPRYF